MTCNDAQAEVNIPGWKFISGRSKTAWILALFDITLQHCRVVVHTRASEARSKEEKTREKGTREKETRETGTREHLVSSKNTSKRTKMRLRWVKHR